MNRRAFLGAASATAASLLLPQSADAHSEKPTTLDQAPAHIPPHAPKEVPRTLIQRMTEELVACALHFIFPALCDLPLEQIEKEKMAFYRILRGIFFEKIVKEKYLNFYEVKFMDCAPEEEDRLNSEATRRRILFQASMVVQWFMLVLDGMDAMQKGGIEKILRIPIATLGMNITKYRQKIRSAILNATRIAIERRD